MSTTKVFNCKYTVNKPYRQTTLVWLTADLPDETKTHMWNVVEVSNQMTLTELVNYELLQKQLMSWWTCCGIEQTVAVRMGSMTGYYIQHIHTTTRCVTATVTLSQCHHSPWHWQYYCYCHSVTVTVLMWQCHRDSHNDSHHDMVTTTLLLSQCHNNSVTVTLSRWLSPWHWQ